MRVAGTTPYYGANGIQDYVDGYTHDGEFILVAEDGANDLKNYPVKCVKGRIWVNNHAHVLQGKYDCADNQFLAYAISQADIESLLVGGGRAKLNAETLMGIDLLLPNKAEQIRIGKYLAQLDNLITLHQREFAFLCKEKSKKFRYIKNAWEQRKFGEVFDCTVPNNTLSRAELSYDEGTVLNVHYGDVLIKYGSVLDVQKDDIPRIPHRCREDFNGALLQDGDVIIADTAEDETTGKACEIGNLQGSAIVSGLHTMVCRPRNRMALGYLGYYLNSNAYHHQLLPLMQGIKVLSLSRSNIQKTSVSYPSAMKEQQLIASYFSQLDHLITLHQRKYEKLVNIKKSMLDKMFPQNGASVPEIRFKGFTDPWEQRKLDELGTIVTGSTPSTTNDAYYADDGLLWVTPTDITKNITCESARKLSASGQKVARVVPRNTILVTCIASIGKNTMLANAGSFNQQINGLTPDENKYVPYFLLTESVLWSAKMKVLAATGTLQIINRTEFSEIKTFLPSFDEQKRISQYFEKLDTLITLHQRKLEKLQNIKKSCLEKMFV